MGSGSSTAKQSEPKPPAESKLSHVANVNNSVKQVSPENLKTRTTEETEKVLVSRSPPVSPKKQTSVEKVTNERMPQTNTRNKSVTKSIKSVQNLEWESDSNFDDDDWDDFLGTNKTREPPAQKRYNDRVKELNSYNEKKSEEQYPETYAQKHTRQQYTFGQDKLIREKTIYRNPDEWRGHDDEEQEEEEEPSTGFNASRFRAANQGKSSRDQQVFSARDEFETPTYLKNREPPNLVPKISNETFQTKELPTYSKEEEDLMNQLLMGGELEPSGHKKANPRYGSRIEYEEPEDPKHQAMIPVQSKLQKSNDLDNGFIGHQAMNHARSKMRQANDFDLEPMAHQLTNHARSKMRQANDFDLEPIAHQSMNHARSKMRQANDFDLQSVMLGHQAMDPAH